MFIFKKSEDIHRYISQKRAEGVTIGFVPTMGALHNGHLSLISESKSRNSLTVCSIFVNPTQFNNPEDFNKYPISIESDIEMLEAEGCDILFLPAAEEIYPAGFKAPYYELGYLENILEGTHRPGHFQGVCMVVERLLDIIPCDVLFLGRKDYQQCMVLQKMIAEKKPDIRIQIVPTMRESDGLAMSSRNRRLTDESRKRATAIFKALSYINQNIASSSISSLAQHAKQMLEQEGFIVDYVEILEMNLKPVTAYLSDRQLVALIAAGIESIRLIDNMIIPDNTIKDS